MNYFVVVNSVEEMNNEINRKDEKGSVTQDNQRT